MPLRSVRPSSALERTFSSSMGRRVGRRTMTRVAEFCVLGELIFLEERVSSIMTTNLVLTGRRDTGQVLNALVIQRP